MRITSQQNFNTLARKRRNPYSRVLRGPHLSNALGLLVQRLARNSGLNHRHGEGKLFVARRCVLCVPLCTQVRSPVQTSAVAPKPFSTELTASTEKEKSSKKEREAATTANRFTSHYRALNTYKGRVKGEARSGAAGPCPCVLPWARLWRPFRPLVFEVDEGGPGE